jgi:hypothetical protein
MLQELQQFNNLHFYIIIKLNPTLTFPYAVQTNK